jgi:hypothetical protein
VCIHNMDLKRTTSCPVKGAPQGQKRLGAAPPPVEFFDYTEFEFDSDDNQCVARKFTVKEENDVATICSEPPKPSAAMATRAYSNNNASARSPISVHEMLEQISEQDENKKSNVECREDYPFDKRKPSDITEVVSNLTIGSPMAGIPIGSPMAGIPMCKNTGIRNPNLKGTGSQYKRNNFTRGQHHRGQQSQKPSALSFRRLFACGGPGVGEIKESIHEFKAGVGEIKESIHDFKANVKQKGVDTVEEVKGSFGDLGLTVRQVFSPVQNTKTGAGMVKEKVVKKVKKLKGEKVDDEYTDEDEVSDNDDYDEGSESGSSLAESESEYNTDEATDDASEESDCKQVTGW